MVDQLFYKAEEEFGTDRAISFSASDFPNSIFYVVYKICTSLLQMMRTSFISNIFLLCILLGEGDLFIAN